MHEHVAGLPAYAAVQPAALSRHPGGDRRSSRTAASRTRVAAAVLTLALAAAGCAGPADSSAGPGRQPQAVRSPAQPACSVSKLLSAWSIRRRAAQLVVAPAGEDAVAAAKPLVAAGVGGLILFGSAAPPALAGELRALRRAAPAGLGPLIMTDEEGGAIQRMADVAGDLPWPRTMAATMTVPQVRALARAAARRMRAAGVTMDLAPVLDLSDGPGPDAAHPDGPRSFSVRAPVASAYGVAFAEGLQDGGVIPVVKHFPGLGQATYNTDYGPASVPRLPVLQAAALLPFRAAVTAGLPAVMVSDAAIPGLTHDLPASLSTSAVTGLLRQRLGFHGLVLTDSLSVPAVQNAGYSVPAAAARAVEAGADMVLSDTADPQATTRQIVAAMSAAVTSGRLPAARLDDAVGHVLSAKHVSLCP
jgi:beta-N-acetylhexosaminidase